MAKKCDTCKYRTRIEWTDGGREWGCDYIGATGSRRPCAVGDNCSVYIFGEAGKRQLPKLFAASRQKEFPARERLYAEGLGDKEIAQQLSVAATTICAWRQRRGYSPNVGRCGDPIKLAERERMYRQGITDSRIAEAQGISASAVTLWRKRRGYAKN